MMRVALNCSKDTTTPKMQLSRLYNKRAQNEAELEPGEFQRSGVDLLAVRRKKPAC